MLILKQSTASQTVLIGPFLDDTDFVSEETGLTIANTDIRLSKAGGNTAAKNSGGGTHDELGFYQITLDATDTDTVGPLQLYVSVAGALPVWHEYHVIEEAIYDSLFAASAAGFDSNQRVDVGSWLGTAVTSGTGGPDVNVNAISDDTTAAANLETAFDGGSYDIGGIDVSELNTAVDAIGSDGTGLTEAGGTGDHLSAVPWNAAWDAEVQSEVTDALEADGLDHLVSASVTGTDVADNSIVARLVSSSATADWDDFAQTTDSLQAIRDHIGDGTNLTEAGGDGDHLTEAGGTGDQLTGVPWNSAWDAEVQSEVTDALEADGLDHLVSASVTGTDVADNSIVARLVSSSATADWDDFVNTTDSLQAVRDHIGDGTNLTEAGGDGDHLTEAGGDGDQLTEAGGTGDQLTAVPWNSNWDAEVESEVADALEATIADSIPSDGTRPSIKQALYMLTQFMTERAVSSTTVTVKKVDGTTSLFTLTLDDGTSPTSITRAS